MKDKKYIKAGLIAVFLILTGVIYSCQRAGSNQQNSTLGTPINLAESSSPESQTDLQAETQKETGETAVEIQEQESAPEQETQIYYVHLCGAVRNPGVYEASEDTRVYELVLSAGGFTKEADENYVNQAANVEDGQQIYIPTREEVRKGNEKIILTDRNSAGSDNAGEDTNKTDKVNINTAAKSELCTLPGIGEVKAASIIDYRTNHGKFQSIEELKQIEGIKDAVYNKIKDMIEAN